MDGYLEIHRRNRKERIQDWVIGALILACLIAASVILVLQFPIPLRHTPMIYHSVELPPDRDYCPGEFYVYVVDIEITEPSILSTHVGVKDAKTDVFILSTVDDSFSIPRSKPSRVKQTVGFPIPDLPPGDYIRVAAIDAENVDSTPIFVEVPFTIGEYCDED